MSPDAARRLLWERWRAAAGSDGGVAGARIAAVWGRFVAPVTAQEAVWPARGRRPCGAGLWRQ
jgi:hypothetical protein